MQLKQRLKRIEAGFDGNESNFCRCFDEFVTQMIDGIYNETAYESDIKNLPKNWCERCGLPINTDLIQEIDKSVSLIYGEVTIA